MAERSRLTGVERVRFVPQAVNLLDGATVERVRRTLAALPEPPALIIIDTLARAMPGGNENAAEDVALFISRLDDLRGDGASLTVHHTRRADEEERGWGGLRGAADMMAAVSRESGGALKLKCSKMKDAAEFAPLPMRLEPASGSRVLSLIVEAERRQDDLRERVLAVVAGRGPVSANAVAEETRKRKADVLAALRALDHAGQVEKTPDGYMPVPVAPEPPGNCPPGAFGGGGSGEGDTPVGGPPGEPPCAQHVEPVPGDLDVETAA